MKLRELPRRALDAVMEVLGHEEPEIERYFVSGALVERMGDHYRIATGDDAWADLEALTLRSDGLCDCGAVLSGRDHRLVCRACGREYLEH